MRVGSSIAVVSSQFHCFEQLADGLRQRSNVLEKVDCCIHVLATMNDVGRQDRIIVTSSNGFPETEVLKSLIA